LLYESDLLGSSDLAKAISFYEKASAKHNLAYERLAQLAPNREVTKQIVDVDNIERITVTAPEMADVLDYALTRINSQHIYTTDVQTGSRIKGRSCVNSLSKNCLMKTGPAVREWAYRMKEMSGLHN
jgi:hypothetical protein